MSLKKYRKPRSNKATQNHIFHINGRQKMPKLQNTSNEKEEDKSESQQVISHAPPACVLTACEQT